MCMLYGGRFEEGAGLDPRGPGCSCPGSLQEAPERAEIDKMHKPA